MSRLLLLVTASIARGSVPAEWCQLPTILGRVCQLANGDYDPSAPFGQQWTNPSSFQCIDCDCCACAAWLKARGSAPRADANGVETYQCSYSECSDFTNRHLNYSVYPRPQQFTTTPDTAGTGSGVAFADYDRLTRFGAQGPLFGLYGYCEAPSCEDCAGSNVERSSGW